MMTFARFKKTSIIIDNIEYILLFVFSLIFIFFLSNGYYSYLLIFLSIIVILVILIIFKITFKISSYQSLSLPLTVNKRKRILIILSILFFIFYGLSFISLIFGFYEKNPLYYFLISICTSILLIEALIIKTYINELLLIFKSFILSLNITLSNQIIFPLGIALPDFKLHYNTFIVPILKYGYIPHPDTFTGTYDFFPGHHIFAVINILFCGSDPKSTYIILGGLLLCSTILFIFLIARVFWNKNFAFISVVLFNCLDYYLMYGAHPEHQAYNYSFSVFLLSIIFLYYFSKNWSYIPCIILLIILIIFTHHFSAMIILILLSILIFLEIIIKIKIKQKYILLPILFIFLLIFSLQLMYYSKLFGSLIQILNNYFISFHNISTNLVESTVYDQVPIKTIFINTIGSSILLCFVVVGFIIFIQRRKITDLFIISISITLSILLVIGICLKQVALLPDRLYPLLQVLSLIFLATEGLQFFLGKIKTNKGIILVAIGIIIPLSFFSLSSTIAGFETSPFIDENLSYYKLYDTTQELVFNKWKLLYNKNSNNEITTLPLSNTGQIEINDIPSNSQLNYNQIYMKTGFLHQFGEHMGQYKFIKIIPEEPYKFNIFNKLYNNNIIISYYT